MEAITVKQKEANKALEPTTVAVILKGTPINSNLLHGKVKWSTEAALYSAWIK